MPERQFQAASVARQWRTSEPTGQGSIRDHRSVQVIDLKDGQVRELCGEACGLPTGLASSTRTEQGRFIVLHRYLRAHAEGDPRITVRRPKAAVRRPRNASESR